MRRAHFFSSFPNEKEKIFKLIATLGFWFISRCTLVPRAVYTRIATAVIDWTKIHVYLSTLINNITGRLVIQNGFRVVIRYIIHAHAHSLYARIYIGFDLKKR